MSDVSESLSTLTKNERSWAIHSGRSPKMSKREQIAQVANLFAKNEWFAQKTDERIPNPAYSLFIQCYYII